MADTFKVLAQVNPAASTLTPVYTPSTAATISSVVICNQDSQAITFRLSVAVAGVADTVKQYLYYDVEVPANDTFIATVGITMAATDELRVYTPSSLVSCNVFGVEIS